MLKRFKRSEPAQHFYGEDLWTQSVIHLKGIIPENYILYGEIIGWTDGGGEVQKNYSYCLPKGTRKLFIYRVAVVNSQGTLVDLSWDAVKEFCASIGVEHVPELARMTVSAFSAEFDSWMDVKYRDEYHQALPLGPEAPCDEGVCLRLEALSPTIVKAKSPLFLAHETKMMDEDVVDLESEGSTLDSVTLAE